MLTDAPASTTVYLIGAGPGDPGLITVAGADVLRRAAVIIYDYLANPELLTLAPPGAELIYVGKSGNQHSKTQDEINQLLLGKAREVGAHPESAHASKDPAVVRLKGGDPYVFGRGGEEGEFLRANNIPFVEIPGITAGIAVPAYAGIPVTHRDIASTLTLVTGHEREDSVPQTAGDPADSSSRVDYAALAGLAKAGGTLVFYMGVKSLPLIAERLRTAGLDPQTPAAVVRWGTRPDQQAVTGTIATIAEAVQAAGLTAPAITIVGRVVTLRDTLNWFERRPLFGQRVIVTRTRQQASDLSARLAALGAQVIEVPTIELQLPAEDEREELDRKLQQLPAYDWLIFTSANSVRAAWQRLRALTFDARHFGASHVAAIGPATAAVLEAIGIVPDVLPEKFVGEELAAALKEHIGDSEIRGQRFLLLQADIARPVLQEQLAALGGIVESLALYRTVKPATLPSGFEALIQAETETTGDQRTATTWVTFTSGSTARNLWDLLSPHQRAAVTRMKRASIGPVTTAALRALGTDATEAGRQESNESGPWAPTVEASSHDISGLIHAMVEASGSAR